MSKLGRQVAQAPDAHNAHPGGWVNARAADWVVNGDAAAKQRGSPLALKPVGNGKHKTSVDPYPVGVPTVAVDAGTLAIRAQIFRTLQAPLAVSAGVSLPADTHAVAIIQT